MSADRSRDWTWLVVAVFLAAQAPFLAGAIRIDETNILAIAEQIAREPADPYGFVINWQGSPERAFDILANPPGVPAYLALVRSVFGDGESVLRLAMLPFAALALWASAAIAAAFGFPRFLGALSVALSPGFFAAAPLVMPDVAMLAFFTLAIAATLRYVDGGTRRDLAIAMAAAFIAPLLKYNASLLLPILGFIWLVTPRRSGGAMAAMLAALSGLVVWNFASWVLYDEVHFFAITGFEGRGLPWMALASAAIYLGLSIVPLPGTAAPLRAHYGWLEAVFILGCAFTFSLLGYSLFYEWPQIVLVAVGGSLGLRIIPEVLLRTASADQDRIRRFLPAVWLAVTLVFILRLNFNATRYMFPLLPIVAILLIGRTWQRSTRWVWIASVPAALLALTVAHADASSAAIYREVARKEIPRLRAAGALRVFYAGHWGWQWYADRMGAIQVDATDPPEWREGDALILPRYASVVVLPPRSRQVVFDVRQIEFRRPSAIQTIDQETAANLYAYGLTFTRRWTLLPFSFGDGVPERFHIFVARSAGEPVSHSNAPPGPNAVVSEPR